MKINFKHKKNQLKEIIIVNCITSNHYTKK